MKFSASLGYLWTDLSLPNAIHAAARAGFAAVECHWPYDTPHGEVKQAMAVTGLPMLGINTRRGDPDQMGLAALPGYKDEACATIREAIAYAHAIKAKNVHVLAGFARGEVAESNFVSNLEFACREAAALGITILIEPLNRHNAPGYFLETTDQARRIIELVDAPNLKLMFDCYHVGRTEGDLITRLRDLLPVIGHIQFAAVPDRGAPDHGEVNYKAVFAAIRNLGWQQPLGAEYAPDGDTDASLDWMSTLV